MSKKLPSIVDGLGFLVVGEGGCGSLVVGVASLFSSNSVWKIIDRAVLIFFI